MGNVTLAGATSGQITLAPTAVAGTNTLTLPASTGTVALTASPTFTGTTTVSNLTLAAGTASLAPEVFTSGTNLTSAIAGAIEYDGKVFYGTPQGTQRGVIPGQQIYVTNSGYVGSNSSSAQSIFGVGVTLSASTQYAFDMAFVLSKSAGTTSHTLALSFNGGTASFNNFLCQGVYNYGGASFVNGANAGASSIGLNTSGSTVVSPAITNATYSQYFMLNGLVSTSTGGTFLPQYTLSAAPGGAYTTYGGSYIRIYPIGASGANISVGAWA